MKKFLAVAAIMICGALILDLLRGQGHEVAMRDFAWSVNEATASYSFELKNPTERAAVVVVVLLAQNRSESHSGTTLRDLGREKIEVTLAPKEIKRMSGTMRLLGLGGSSLAISSAVSVSTPSQSTKPTLSTIH